MTLTRLARISLAILCSTLGKYIVVCIAYKKTFVSNTVINFPFIGRSGSRN